jgi:hypothetical protein
MTRSRYRAISLALAATFAAVGLLFLVLPDAALAFMNSLGRGFGLPEAPPGGAGFYLGLAVGYMYVVTVLAWMMSRHPADRRYPLLLAHAKGASGLLSLALLVFHRPYFIYAANGLIDLSLAALAWILYLSRKKAEAASS